MDSALELRIAYDGRNITRPEQAEPYLAKSELVARLTGAFDQKPLYAVWRMIALSEIPYASTLAYTSQLFEYVNRHLASSDGFTLTGKGSDLLPCYNAMLIEAYSKLGRADAPTVQSAVEWIVKYQPFERNVPSLWHGKGTGKYGGCLKATPCYIGVVKSVKALAAYDHATCRADERIAPLVSKGMDYILKHELYKRLTDSEPITQHILDLAFPASYQLNIVELLELAYRTDRIRDARCQSAIDLVNGKKTRDGYWKSSYAYKSEGYLSFDHRGEKAEWLTYLLGCFLGGLS